MKITVALKICVTLIVLPLTTEAFSSAPLTRTVVPIRQAARLTVNPSRNTGVFPSPVSSTQLQVARVGKLSSTRDQTARKPKEETVTSENATTPIFEGFGKGARRDFAARLPLYGSDIKDGLNVQSLAATLFLVFACLAPAVGFGGLYHSATGGAIGTVEMILSTAMGGVLYHLTAAQPLTIIGATGPVVAFTACLAQIAKMMSLPFLPLYAWTGLWSSGILMLASLTSASNLVKYLTRFTDEIFSTLISTIFIVEAFTDVAGAFGTTSLTKAFLTLSIASMTYMMSSTLKKVRKSPYFTKRIRKTISNFAPTIGVVTACLTARYFKLKHGAAVAGLPSLVIPATFGTTTGRPWLVPLLDLPVWARWAAFLPALMATVLLFLDQNITVRLVNNPRWKMNKGRKEGNVLDGMHADMFVLSILTALQSVTGLPWLVAATVRSLSHVGALTKTDENTGKVVGTHEQRVTGVAIHALIGCTIFLSKPRQLLTQVPMPVLMGLFMYMGVSSLPGNEMWERFLGLFHDKTVAQEKRWTNKVPPRMVKRLTYVQLACLGAMFWVKESPIGVLFPILVALLAPIRFGLERFNTIPKAYMDVLDAEE